MNDDGLNHLREEALTDCHKCVRLLLEDSTIPEVAEFADDWLNPDDKGSPEEKWKAAFLVVFKKLLISSASAPSESEEMSFSGSDLQQLGIAALLCSSPLGIPKDDFFAGMSGATSALTNARIETMLDLVAEKVTVAVPVVCSRIKLKEIGDESDRLILELITLIAVSLNTLASMMSFFLYAKDGNDTIMNIIQRQLELSLLCSKSVFTALS